MTEALKHYPPLAVGSNDGLERMRRVWQMPAADTFDVAAIGALVRKYLRGVSVDPFARNKRWATYTNDLNPATRAEHHMQAPEFLSMLADQGVTADVVLFDPPYSPRQVAECYAAAGVPVTKTATQNAALYAACRREIRRLCKRGTVVLSFGWNTCGMGSGFRTEELLIVCHGAAHNDTLCLVERMHEEQMELRSNARLTGPKRPPQE
jgi:hypothetical protein